MRGMDPRQLSKLLAGLATVSLIAASCGASGSPSGIETGSATSGAEVPVQTSSAVEGPAAPILVGLADGGQLDWNSLAGKDVMLWFWAPW